MTHYRHPAALWKCLESVESTLFDTAHELIVADSEAQPGIGGQLHERFPQVDYLPFERNVGFARLVNAGLRRAVGDPVLILNGDTVLEPHCVERLRQALDVDPSLALVGPTIVNPDGTLQHSAFRFHRPFTLLARRTKLGRTPAGMREIGRFRMDDVLTRPAPGERLVPADWVAGAAWMVRREAVEAVGPLDEGYFLYFEDVDWCRRFWEAGWRVAACRDATVTHLHGRASRAHGGLRDVFTNRYTRVHVRSAIRYFAKFGPRVPRYGS
ncbi:MAG TPA: glycosyltransferase family 2 protein [Nitriliruptorales bacterium]|nr:glycosyltransferase family 2 protein [Nitriliruptorales bacterium]